MKNPLVIISEGDIVGNKGAVAMVYCIVDGIKKKFPEAKFIITSKFIKENKFIEEKGIETLYDNEQAFDIPLIKVWLWWLLSKIGINLNIILNDKVLNAYKNADLIVSASGISFHDNFGFAKIYHFSKYIQLPFFLDKKVIKFTQSIGPFNTQFNKMMAKLVLNRTHMIFARGENSLNNLRSIGIEESVKVFPDIAVTMSPVKSARTEKIINNYWGKKIIGISPNIVCKKLDRKNNYIPSLEKLAEYIFESIDDSIIILIPHTIEEKNLNNDDDYSICSHLFDHMKDQTRCEIVNTLDYSPEEVKWLISRCEFFVGSRFHSLIASTSSGVPSIAIGWHWKYEEMMLWFNLENNIIQYWDLTSEKLITIFEKNFMGREEIRRDLLKIVPELKIKSNEAINVLCEILDEKN